MISPEHRAVFSDQLRTRRRGRRPLDVPNPVVQITLSPELFDQFDRVARERDEPLARVIRQALEQHRPNASE